MEYVFGIDVSRWQGSFSFQTAKSDGVRFAILRGAHHLSKDTMFDSNYTAAKAQDLNVGVYQYSMAETTAQAKQEAEFLYDSCLKGRKFELPIFIDVEDEVQKKLGKTALTAIVKAWCEALEAKGFWVGIYASNSFYGTYVNDSELLTYSHWVAQWAKDCTYSNKNVLGVWQFGGETNLLRSNKIAGVTCDQDYMLIDYPSLIKKAGKNGYSVQETAPTTDYKALYEELLKQLEALKGQVSSVDKELSQAQARYQALVDKVKGLVS